MKLPNLSVKAVRHIGAYERKDGGPIHIVCDDKPEGIKLFLTWSEIRTNIDDNELLSDIVVPYVLPVDFVEGATQREGAKATTFHIDKDLSNGEENYYPEKVTAIPGTDFRKLRDVKTSWNDLNGGSCIFEFMVAIADKLWSGTETLYAFAGHSLGGSVTQYVAQQLAPASEKNRNDPARKAKLQAYAFNAIGLDESRGANPENLHSFYIEDDPVVDLGDYWDRIQGGRVVRYTPPTPSWGELGSIWEARDIQMALALGCSERDLPLYESTWKSEDNNVEFGKNHGELIPVMYGNDEFRMPVSVALLE